MLPYSIRFRLSDGSEHRFQVESLKQVLPLFKAIVEDYSVRIVYAAYLRI